MKFKNLFLYAITLNLLCYTGNVFSNDEAKNPIQGESNGPGTQTTKPISLQRAQEIFHNYYYNYYEHYLKDPNSTYQSNVDALIERDMKEVLDSKTEKEIRTEDQNLSITLSSVLNILRKNNPQPSENDILADMGLSEQERHSLDRELAQLRGNGLSTADRQTLQGQGGANGINPNSTAQDLSNRMGEQFGIPSTSAPGQGFGSNNPLGNFGNGQGRNNPFNGLNGNGNSGLGQYAPGGNSGKGRDILNQAAARMGDAATPGQGAGLGNLPGNANAAQITIMFQHPGGDDNQRNAGYSLGQAGDRSGAWAVAFSIQNGRLPNAEETRQHWADFDRQFGTGQQGGTQNGGQQQNGGTVNQGTQQANTGRTNGNSGNGGGQQSGQQQNGGTVNQGTQQTNAGRTNGNSGNGGGQQSGQQHGGSVNQGNNNNNRRSNADNSTPNLSSDSENYGTGQGQSGFGKGGEAYRSEENSGNYQNPNMGGTLGGGIRGGGNPFIQQNNNAIWENQNGGFQGGGLAGGAAIWDNQQGQPDPNASPNFFQRLMNIFTPNQSSNKQNN